jgi:pimeloyl-ACP methyl ester carboxylesterase
MCGGEQVTEQLRMIGFHQRIVEIDEAVIEVFVSDSGGPLLCTAHPFVPTQGNTMESLSQSSFMRALAASAQLIVVNPRGSGNSSPIRRADDLRLHRLAADIEAIRVELSITQWMLAGGSSGANVALLYALSYPQALQALLLFSTGPDGSAVVQNSQSIASPRHPRQAGLESVEPLQVVPSALEEPEVEWRQLQPALWGLFRGGAPCLMLSGDALRPLPIRQRAALEDYAKSARQ